MNKNSVDKKRAILKHISIIAKFILTYSIVSCVLFGGLLFYKVFVLFDNIFSINWVVGILATHLILFYICAGYMVSRYKEVEEEIDKTKDKTGDPKNE